MSGVSAQDDDKGWVTSDGGRGGAVADGAAEGGEGGDDACPEVGEFFVAEGVVVGLEDGAEEERIDSGVLLCVAPEFDGLEALQLGDD